MTKIHVSEWKSRIIPEIGLGYEADVIVERDDRKMRANVVIMQRDLNMNPSYVAMLSLITTHIEIAAMSALDRLECEECTHE